MAYVIKHDYSSFVRPVIICMVTFILLLAINSSVQACIDSNSDGLDDGSGIDCVSPAPPGSEDVYDPDFSDELPDSDWVDDIRNWMMSNPLIAVATGTGFMTSNEYCSITQSVYGGDITISLCNFESIFQLCGAVIVGLTAVKCVLIAMGSRPDADD